MCDRDMSDLKSIAAPQKKKRCHHVGDIEDTAFEIVWIK